MITKDFWVVFNKETGALEALFVNEWNATQFHKTFDREVTPARAMSVTYDIQDFLEVAYKKFLQEREQKDSTKPEIDNT